MQRLYDGEGVGWGGWHDQGGCRIVRDEGEGK